MTVHLDPATIGALAESVRKPREAIEMAFVEAGDRLSESASLLNTLTRLFEALPGTLQGEEMGAAVQHLDAVSERALTLSDRFDFEKSDLDSLVGVVNAAASPITALRRTIKMMGIVSINARVTAAGIVGTDEDFDVFTSDIKSLSDTAHSTIQQFAQVYRQLADEVGRAASQRSAFEGAHAKTLTSLATKLHEAILALNTHQQSAAEASVETGRVGRQITGRIGNTVMALQVGDATRQRLEHVEAILENLRSLKENGELFGVAVAPENIDVCTKALCMLQDKLFGDCVDTFADEVSAAQSTLRALVADASVIISLSRAFQGDKSGNGSAISNLNSQLGSAVTTVNDFEAERAKLEATSSSVQKLVTKLLDHVSEVQDIEASMHLVSLNTAVRCAQMGPRGAPLSIIAMQLRELTGETVTAAQAAMVELTKATELAANLRHAETEQSESGEAGLETQAKAALEIVTTLDQRITTALRQLNSDGPRVIRLLETAERGLEGQTRLVAQLDAIKAEIEGLTPEAEPFELPEAVGEAFAKLRKIYTMEAERAIHDSLCGTPVKLAPVIAAAASAETSMDDIFFGFDEPEAEAPSVTQDTSDDLGDFDFFETPEPEAEPLAVEPVAAEADDALGDFDFFGDEPLEVAPEEAAEAPAQSSTEKSEIDDFLF